MQEKKKIRMCTSNVSEDMARNRDTWMEGVQVSVGSWKDKNSEICMDLCVCACKCEKPKGGKRI